jgi:hypothetical protein
MPEPIYSARVPAGEFAVAWLNVAQACSDDKARVHLHKSVKVEFMDDRTVRLVATDSAMLLYAVVASDEHDRPGLDATPEAECVARDIVGSGRMGALMRHVVAMRMKAEKDDLPFNLHAHLDLLQEPHDAGLLLGFDGMEPVTLRVRIADEELKMPTWEGTWPGWTHVPQMFEPAPKEGGVLPVRRLQQLAAMVTGQPGDPARVSLRLGHQVGNDSLPVARIVVDCDPPVWGLTSLTSAVVDESFAYDPLAGDDENPDDDGVTVTITGPDGTTTPPVTASDLRRLAGSLASNDEQAAAIRDASVRRAILSGGVVEPPRDELTERRQRMMAQHSDVDD